MTARGRFHLYSLFSFFLSPPPPRANICGRTAPGHTAPGHTLISLGQKKRGVSLLLVWPNNKPERWGWVGKRHLPYVIVSPASELKEAQRTQGLGWGDKCWEKQQRPNFSSFPKKSPWRSKMTDGRVFFLGCCDFYYSNIIQKLRRISLVVMCIIST